MIQEGEQRTLDWHRARLGNITGSAVGDLMKTGRKKDEMFGETAKTYMNKLAAQRCMNPAIVANDALFEDWVKSKEITSRAIRWGQEKEDEAKRLFYKRRGIPKEMVVNVASCQHDTIPHFAASPDALIYTDRERGVFTALEVKCPEDHTFMKYVCEVKDAETLKAVKPEYYWQMMAEMSCTGAGEGIFLTYCPWLSIPYHAVMIMRNELDIQTLEERVIAANAYIDGLVAQATANCRR
jgi:hypothetical protein